MIYGKQPYKSTNQNSGGHPLIKSKGEHEETHVAKSKLHVFTIALAVLGLLAMPSGGSYGMQRGHGLIASSEGGTHEEEVD